MGLCSNALHCMHMHSYACMHGHACPPLYTHARTCTCTHAHALHSTHMCMHAYHGRRQPDTVWLPHTYAPLTLSGYHSHTHR